MRLELDKTWTEVSGRMKTGGTINLLGLGSQSSVDDSPPKKRSGGGGGGGGGKRKKQLFNPVLEEEEEEYESDEGNGRSEDAY